MSKSLKTAPEKIEMFPIGYVENDYLEPVYNEEIYQKISKIRLFAVLCGLKIIA